MKSGQLVHTPNKNRLRIERGKERLRGTGVIVPLKYLGGGNGNVGAHCHCKRDRERDSTRHDTSFKKLCSVKTHWMAFAKLDGAVAVDFVNNFHPTVFTIACSNRQM